VALVVAVTAVGPLAAALSGTAIGPLSVLRFLVLAPLPDPATVAAACTDPAALEECVGLRLAGLGPAIMSVLPVLVLLVLADGLRLGRRLAWWTATGMSLGFALLGAGLALSTASSRTDRLVAFGGVDDPQFYLGAATAIVQPLLTVALLVATRAHCRMAAPARAWRGPALVVTVTLVATHHGGSQPRGHRESGPGPAAGATMSAP
jgi:phosphatidylglycerol lysyltransferase